MSEQQPTRQYKEKPEKQEEKDEKSRHEKTQEEKWRRDPLNAAAWALILIWLGLVALAGTTGLISGITFDNAWPWFFVGAGAILLLEVLFRLLVPSYRAPIVGTLILGLIFLAIGLGEVSNNWNIIWPLIIIAIGLSLLFRGLFRRKE